MLSRYDGKTIRLTTTDGEVFTGEADVYPSGYGLDTFGVEEESVCINDTFVFLSQIARIEPPQGFAVTQADKARYLAQTSALLEKPCRIAVPMPQSDPDGAEGQFFMVSRYFRLPPQLSVLRRKQSRILLQLNSCFDMIVTADGVDDWEKNPDPERFVRTVDGLSGSGFLRVLFPSQNVLIELYANDIQMTIVSPDPDTTERIRQLAAAEGLFLWNEEE